MSLKLKLRPDETVVVNGCLIKNGPRRNSLIIENFANIIREPDLMRRERATTPVKAIYYAIQSMLIAPTSVEGSIQEVQKTLAQIHRILPDECSRARVMEAANNISVFDFYKALACLRPLIKQEDEAEAEQAGAEAATAVTS